MTNKPHDIRDIKKLARQRWREILSQTCPELHTALEKPGVHVDCPIHGGKRDFRLFRDYETNGDAICTCGHYDGFDLIMAINHCTLNDAIQMVADVIGAGSETAAPAPRERRDPPKKYDAQADIRKKQALQIVQRHTKVCKPGDTNPVIRYLRRRGLNTAYVPKAVGYNQAVRYYDTEKERYTGRFPCMVAVFHDITGKPVTLHNTYLTQHGEKAPVNDVKKMMAFPSTDSVRGGAVRLFEPAGVLGIAEGIETALAVHQATKMPVWACLTAGLLQQVVIPDSVSFVVIWADKDRGGAGQEAAGKLAAKLRERGIQTQVMLPPGEYGDQKGIDWLDVLNREGERPFFEEETELVHGMAKPVLSTDTPALEVCYE